MLAARRAIATFLVLLHLTARPCVGFSAPSILSAGQMARANVVAARRANRNRCTLLHHRTGRRAQTSMMMDSTTLAQAAETVATVPGAAYAWYIGALTGKGALSVDTATASVLYTLGVLTETAITGKAISARVVATWACLGLADGLATHAWYGFLQSRADDVTQQLVSVSEGVLTYPGQLPEGIDMTLVSNLLFTPLYCTGFLLLLSLLEGKGWDGAIQRVQLDVQALFWKATKVWGLSNLMLFSFVPVDVRTATSMGIHYVFLVAVALWNTAALEGRTGPGAAAGPEIAERGSSSELLQLRAANAFYAVDDQVRMDGSDPSSPASPPDA